MGGILARWDLARPDLSGRPTRTMPLTMDDRFSTAYTTGFIFVQIVLLTVVANHRLPTLQRRIARVSAAKHSNQASQHAAVLAVVQIACCIALAAQYIAFQVAGPGVPYTDEVGDSSETTAFYRACWVVGALRWVLCVVLVFFHYRARCHAGASLRCWWILDFLVASVQLHSALKMTIAWDRGSDTDATTSMINGAHGVSLASVIQNIGFTPHAVLFACAVFQGNTPIDPEDQLTSTAPKAGLLGLLGQGAPPSSPGRASSSAGRSKEASASFFSCLTFSWVRRDQHPLLPPPLFGPSHPLPALPPSNDLSTDLLLHAPFHPIPRAGPVLSLPIFPHPRSHPDLGPHPHPHSHPLHQLAPQGWRTASPRAH